MNPNSPSHPVIQVGHRITDTPERLLDSHKQMIPRLQPRQEFASCLALRQRKAYAGGIVLEKSSPRDARALVLVHLSDRLHLGLAGQAPRVDAGANVAES